MNPPPARHDPLEFEITFCVRGVITAPCGEPMSLDVHSAPSITPAFSHLRITRIMRGSPIRCSTKRMSHSRLIESKNHRTSPSTLQPTSVYVLPTPTHTP